MSNNQFSRLASVNKILMDREVIALRKENDRLQKSNDHLLLNLFWIKFCSRNLTCRTQLSNFIHPESPDCNCYLCGIGGRLSETQMTNDVHNPICTFTPLLKNTFAYLGLVVAETMDIASIQPLVHEYSWDFVNIDAHIVVEEDWTRFAYGSKLFNVTSMDDPSIAKIKSLFEILETEPLF